MYYFFLRRPLLVQAWAVDVPDPRSIGLMLKWLRRSDLDASELGNLKRVRKQNNTSTFLLSVSTSPSLSSEPRCLFADRIWTTILSVRSPESVHSLSS
ncbi:hypothetical protein DFH08DRAFT_948749 [Mycena albidolilacea]|uniref:Uncharacterized protein n=1 Tax=Mycena albidolilacea TaxID=1033008 RepID=A0AAD7F4R9_9AGAR|nr:hypothetical protein DFH08DRAFT_948749 [Mycena albidolilacea]